MGFDPRPVEDWLQRAPHVPDGGLSLAGGLADALRAAGLPLWRLTFVLRTKHPEVLWRTLQWLDGEGATIIDRQHATKLDPYSTRSPVARLMEGSPPIRVPLVEGPLPFPICEDLRARGATEYYAHGLSFLNDETTYVAFATRAAGGFEDASVAALDGLAPALGRRLELESAYHATRTLLEVYLGRNAARRVDEGAFRRGEGELIPAAIWFCDLRGFTPLSDRLAPRAVVELLDAYFDRVAGAVTARGGEVLKFVGDAILAIFPVEAATGGAPDACARALRAADDALAALAAFNEGRAAGDALAIGVGLHLGDVMYGNIGSKERLDFTVISSSVNEACRLESLCKELGTTVALSAAFAAELAGEDLVDLGEQALKGVPTKRRVLTPRRHRRAAAP
jgi:adenylate cyclase